MQMTRKLEDGGCRQRNSSSLHVHRQSEAEQHHSPSNQLELASEAQIHEGGAVEERGRGARTEAWRRSKSGKWHHTSTCGSVDYAQTAAFFHFLAFKVVEQRAFGAAATTSYRLRTVVMEVARTYKREGESEQEYAERIKRYVLNPVTRFL